MNLAQRAMQNAAMQANTQWYNSYGDISPRSAGLYASGQMLAHHARAAVREDVPDKRLLLLEDI